MTTSLHDTAPSSQALPPGTRLEEFVIERVLGSGGFGITYLARDTALGRQVVIKENLPVQFCFRDTHSLTVAPRHTSGEDADNFKWSLENFSKEAAMLASLDHPGIVKVLRSFQAFGTAYFVMPFVEGVTLDELSKERQGKPLNEEELRSLLERLLPALGHLHDRGIYHRDIKPGNILITNEGLPVLIDFGSARQRLSERSMTVVESAGYTPFELLQTRGNVGPWSDLYALGATLVKVMTGETPPKTNDRTMGDPWQPLAGREDLRGRFSEGFLSGVDRALKLPIEERWQSAEEWKVVMRDGVLPKESGHEAMCNVVEHESSAVATPRERLLWAVAGFIVLVCLVAFGYALQTPATCGLAISSEPAGAELRDVAGFLLGKTPVELTALPGGRTWQGVLKMDGYLTEELVIDLWSRETQVVPVIKLRPAPQKVVVKSDPEGAVVLEGGRMLGVTPLELPEISPGTKLVYQLKLDGHRAAEVAGEVLVGESLELAGVLEVFPQRAFEGTKAGEEREFEIAPGVKMVFCWCPAGEFVMGSPPDELGRDSDEKQVEVTLSKGFWLAKTEVTQGQWNAAGGIDVSGRPPSFWDGKVQYTWEQHSGFLPANFNGVNLPVERVDWNEVRDWSLGLTERLRNDKQLEEGWKLGLPTEAQWEYACRAGTHTALHSGRNLTSKDGVCRNLNEVDWYWQNSEKKMRPVGMIKANAWGLHDMHGNVREWCLDWYAEALVGGVDPQGAALGVHSRPLSQARFQLPKLERDDRAFRGGSWNDSAGNCRAAYRGRLLPDNRDFRLGFRPALVPSE